MRLPVFVAAATLVAGFTPAPLLADTYVIDTEGAHASINFRIKHLGYSWLTGRFDAFSGRYQFDPDQPEAAQVNVEIATASINSNHAERDKHLRSSDFLHVDRHPTATFESNRIELTGQNTGVIYGDLTLNGVTREVAIEAEFIGGGADPWGGYRTGFAGTTRLTLADFGIDYNLGPEAREVELNLNVEGIRQ